MVLNRKLPVIAAGLWISFSEFFRNEFLLKEFWTSHFASLGLKFETLPANGLLWGVWSFALAYLVFKLFQKFSFWESVFLAWLPSFFMMWVVVYNLQVLPLGILVAATPLSLLEVAVAAEIIKKLRVK
jgi:hypothetical protein